MICVIPQYGNVKFTEKSSMCPTYGSTFPISYIRQTANLILLCVLSFLQWTKRLAKENPLRRHLYKLPRFSVKPNFRYQINNGPSLDAILCQVKPTLTSPQSSFKIHLNIILPTPKGFKWYHHSKPSNQRVWILVYSMRATCLIRTWRGDLNKCTKMSAIL